MAVPLALLSLGLALPAQATPVTLTATADTYLTNNAGLGGATSVHGSDAALWMVLGPGSSPIREIPLIRFDLSGHAGESVVGDAQLTLQLVSALNGAAGVTQTATVREVLVPWDETTSFSNFGGSGFDETLVGTFFGPVLSSTVVTFDGSPPDPFSFVVPVSVVQGWIDDPTSNHGLALISQTVALTALQGDLIFASRERTGGSLAPVLSFDAVPVPEPRTAYLLVPGLLAVAALGRRRTLATRKRGSGEVRSARS